MTFYDPSMAGPNIPQGLGAMLNQFMMLKQLKEQRGQQMWERGMEERRMESLEKFREAQAEEWARPPAPPRLPAVPAEIQAARLVATQTGEPIGLILQRWHTRATKPEETGIKKSRKTWLTGLNSTISSMIRGIQGDPLYGELSPDLVQQVANLQESQTAIRNALAYGTEKELPTEMWGELTRISDNLSRIQQEGLYWKTPEEEPSFKARLPKINRNKLEPGTEIKWNPDENIKMAKVKGVWHWVID